MNESLFGLKQRKPTKKSEDPAYERNGRGDFTSSTFELEEPSCMTSIQTANIKLTAAESILILALGLNGDFLSL